MTADEFDRELANTHRDINKSKRHQLELEGIIKSIEIRVARLSNEVIGLQTAERLLTALFRGRGCSLQIHIQGTDSSYITHLPNEHFVIWGKNPGVKIRVHKDVGGIFIECWKKE